MFGDRKWNEKDLWVCFDDNEDYAGIKDDPPQIVGHGTPIALIAGGSRIGVAPRANLLLYKVQTTLCENDGTADQPKRSDKVEQGYNWLVLVQCLQDLVTQLDTGKLPKGKTVLSISIGEPAPLSPFRFAFPLFRR